MFRRFIMAIFRLYMKYLLSNLRSVFSELPNSDWMSILAYLLFQHGTKKNPFPTTIHLQLPTIP